MIRTAASCDSETFWHKALSVCASCLELCQETYIGDVSILRQCCPTLLKCGGGLPRYASAYCSDVSPQLTVYPNFHNDSHSFTTTDPKLAIGLTLAVVLVVSVLAVLIGWKTRHWTKRRLAKKSPHNVQPEEPEVAPLNPAANNQIGGNQIPEIQIQGNQIITNLITESSPIIYSPTDAAIQTASPSTGDSGRVTAAHSSENIGVPSTGYFRLGELSAQLDAIYQQETENNINQTVTLR